mmetsp:Transcript_7916/g.10530  ORF Transcript_7916/g.10530 Transcript_7916/m.10530 type:complete len:146 (-) Transcript_7916:488-925(-)
MADTWKFQLFLTRYIFIILFLSTQIFPVFGSKRANDPVEDNVLGLTTRDCAKKYCIDKPALDLWLSLQEVCYPTGDLDAAKHFRENRETKMYAKESTKGTDSLNQPLSSTMVGAICAVTGVLGMMIGFQGGAFASRRIHGEYLRI